VLGDIVDALCEWADLGEMEGPELTVSCDVGSVNHNLIVKKSKQAELPDWLITQMVCQLHMADGAEGGREGPSRDALLTRCVRRLSCA
jgi:hypothetical protein